MTSIQDKIRETAEQVLTDGKADLVIGFSESSLPMRAAPCFITKADCAKELVWNRYCLNNLAVYLPKYFAPDPHLRAQKAPPKIAVVLKGCDGRSAVGLIKELQVPRENLVVITAPCEGMFDAAIAQKLIGDNEVVSAREDKDSVIVKDETGKETKFNRGELLAEACRFCTHRTSPISDIAVGGPGQNGDALSPDDRFEEFLKKTTEERWELFCHEISKCVFCKACRSACPNCYCKVCFADQTRPNWTGSGGQLQDLIAYHLGRIFHQAGRCVDCGACVRACPVGIDLRTFTYKVVKDAKDLFDFTAGLDIEQAPPLTEFSSSDSDSFITEPE